MLVGLAGSAILAGMLAAAQLIPVLEFTGQSGRAADEGPHDIYPFSLEPARLAEFVWPNVFGTHFHGNRHWLTALPPTNGHAKAWVPSLYLGGLTILLALGAMGFRGGPPWRSWLTAIAVVSLLAAMGEYTSPIYWARWVPACARAIGPHDPVDVASIRFDGYLRDGDGGVYWFLATVLPGFRQFRYPSKLLSFTVLALAALAGIGWERVASGRARRTAYLASGLLVLTLAALAIASIYRGRIVEAFQAANRSGPPPPSARWIRRGPSPSCVVRSCRRRSSWRWGWPWRSGDRVASGLAGAVALIAVTADLGLANARYVLTAPQALFETDPEGGAVDPGRRAGRPRPGALSHPPDADLEPHGLASGVVRRSGARLRRLGTRHPPAEIRPPLRRPVHADPRRRRALRLRVLLRGLLPDGRRRDGQGHEAARRQARWSTTRGGATTSGTRATSCCRSSRTAGRTSTGAMRRSCRRPSRSTPRPTPSTGPEGKELQKQWLEREDFQILRNKAAYPRAWIVHQARYLDRIVGLGRKERQGPMEEMLYQDDAFWNDPTRRVHDPTQIAWVEADDAADLAGPS